jgi:hypothetical protein
MEKPSFELSDGASVFIRAFNLSYTYEYLIEGKPTKELNNLIVNSITFPGDWKMLPHVIIMKNMYLEPNIIKQYKVTAWLVILPECNKELDYDGKEIAVTFFTNEISTKSIEQVVLNAIQFTNWPEYADKFLI